MLFGKKVATNFRLFFGGREGGICVVCLRFSPSALYSQACEFSFPSASGVPPIRFVAPLGGTEHFFPPLSFFPSARGLSLSEGKRLWSETLLLIILYAFEERFTRCHKTSCAELEGRFHATARRHRRNPRTSYA